MDPLIYSYAVGRLIFAVGLFFAAKQGYLGFRGRGLVHLLACVGVIGFFFALQAHLQYAPMETADPVPYNGGAEHVTGADADGSVRGTALDYGIMIGYFVIILGIGTSKGLNPLHPGAGGCGEGQGWKSNFLSVILISRP